MWKKAALALAGATSALLIVELAVRTLHILPPRSGAPRLRVDRFDSLPGVLTPGRYTWNSGQPLEHTVSINSLGYRGGEIGGDRPTSGKRVLFVGDSFVFGHHTNDEETLPAQLEGHLRRDCAGNIEVINAGVSGSTIVTQAKLVRRARPLRPDLIILQFFPNDIAELTHGSFWQWMAAQRARDATAWGRVRLLLRYSAAWRFFADGKNRLLQRLNRPDPSKGSVHSEESLRLDYRQALRALADELAASQTPLVVTAFPDHPRKNAAIADQRVAWFVGAAREMGLHTIDLTPSMRPARPQMYLLPWDGHASRQGYAAAAQLLANDLGAWLEPRGWCTTDRRRRQ